MKKAPWKKALRLSITFLRRRSEKFAIKGKQTFSNVLLTRSYRNQSELTKYKFNFALLLTHRFCYFVQFYVS